MELSERIIALCDISKQDLLLSKQNLNSESGKSWWTKWTKTSQWDWINEPTDRQVMYNEIVIETDEDMEFNKKLTKIFQATLKEMKISYYTYFTSSKSFHIHIFIDGIENITGDQRRLIKLEIAKEITKDNYKYIDKANFIEKGLIRIEGSIHPKTNKRVRLFDKFISNNYKLTNELIERTKVIKPNLENVESSKKEYCQVVEEALIRKFKAGQRNRILLPNCVAILSNDELHRLSEVQNINFAEIEGWKKNKPKFNCIQLRRYAKEIGMDFYCKQCIRVRDK